MAAGGNNKNGTSSPASKNNGKLLPDKGAGSTSRSIEDTVLSLRRELREVYETLREKNEQLVQLDKDVRDRDISIRYLKNEFKKLKDYYQNTKSDLSIPPNINLNGNSKEDSGSSLEDLLQKVQKECKEKDLQIRELNQKVIRLSNNLIYVQKESLSKDDRIDVFQNEIDKFRQVVSICRELSTETCHYMVSFSGPSHYQGNDGETLLRGKLRLVCTGYREHPGAADEPGAAHETAGYQCGTTVFASWHAG